MCELMMGELKDNLIFHAQYDNNGLKGHSYVFKFQNEWGAFVSTDYGDSDRWEIQLVRVIGDDPVQIVFEAGMDVAVMGGYEYRLTNAEICNKLRLIKRHSSYFSYGV